jgi:hypothetical protein
MHNNMAKDKSSGNSDTATVESEEGEFSEIDFESRLAQLDPTLDSSEETPEVIPDESEDTEEDSEADEAEGETEEEAEEEEDTEESDEEPESDDVLSQIDFDALTDEQKQEIAKAVGSGAGKELGKLRGGCFRLTTHTAISTPLKTLIKRKLKWRVATDTLMAFYEEPKNTSRFRVKR